RARRLVGGRGLGRSGGSGQRCRPYRLSAVRAGTATTAIRRRNRRRCPGRQECAFGRHPRSTGTARSRSAARIMAHGTFTGAPGRIRTCDLEIRRLLLYPAELRAPNFSIDLSTGHPASLNGTAVPTSTLPHHRPAHRPPRHAPDAGRLVTNRLVT